MDDVRNADGERVLKSLRLQTSSQEVATAWFSVCTHTVKHVHLEGGDNCVRSARYSGQMCNALVKHILQRPARLLHPFQDTAIKSIGLQCYLCSDSEDTNVPDDSVRDSDSDEETHFLP